MDKEIFNWFHRIESHLKAIKTQLQESPKILSSLTKKEVALRLNVSIRKLQYMIADREIVGFYVGNEWRMKPENLERWIEQRESLL